MPKPQTKKSKKFRPNKQQPNQLKKYLPFAAAAAAFSAVLGLLFLWWKNRTIVRDGVLVDERINSLLRAAETLSLKTDGVNKVQLHAYVGTHQVTGVRGLHASRDLKKGESVVVMPTSAVIQPHEIFPAHVWQNDMLKLRIKGFPRQTSVLPHHQLAMGVLGCSINAVTGDKVLLAREYYRANGNFYPFYAYQYWKSHHRKFLNSMPMYSKINRAPQGVQSWTVFNHYYRTRWNPFPPDKAKHLYTMVTSNALSLSGSSGGGDEAPALLPLIDTANHAAFPNANVTCTQKGCKLVMLRNVKEGAEITREFEVGSNLFLLQKHGYDAGSTNMVAGHTSHSNGCRVPFASLAKYPKTGGIRSSEWECLRKDLSASTIFRWAMSERKKVHQELKQSNIEILTGQDDELTKTLLRLHRDEMSVFKDETPRYWSLLISKTVKEEEKEAERLEWRGNAINAFEAAMSKEEE